jgi:hypothetical protein
MQMAKCYFNGPSLGQSIMVEPNLAQTLLKNNKNQIYQADVGPTFFWG